LFNNSGQLDWDIHGVTEIATTDLLSAGAWHHIVASYTGSRNDLYVDGVSVVGEDVIGAIPATTDDLYIGTNAAADNNVDTFDGTIDEVRIYNRGLTASEVARLYQSGAVKINASSADLDNGSSLESGLVGHWTFDGPDLTDRVYDRSGNGNNGYFISGATSSAKVIGKLGQALQFDGVDDYVLESTADPIGSGAVTISAWIYPRTFGETGPTAFILDAYDTGGSVARAGCLIDGTSNVNVFGCTNDGSASANSADSAIVLNSWQFVTGVRNSSGKWTIYVNGAQSGSANQSAGTSAAGTQMSIGMRFDPGYHFNGSIDDLRIYNRALSAAEINQLSKLGTVTIRPN
jgi:hypothetical protein